MPRSMLAASGCETDIDPGMLSAWKTTWLSTRAMVNSQGARDGIDRLSFGHQAPGDMGAEADSG